MIRVCHVADHLNGEIDGVYNHIIEIIRLTDKKKFEHFLCYQGNSKIDSEIKQLGGKIIALPQLMSKFPILAIMKFIFLVRMHKLDIIHAHFIKSYIIAGLSNLVLGKKLIYNFHGLFIDNEYYNFLEKKFYNMLHFIVCRLGAVDVAIVPSMESENQLRRETKTFPRIIQYYNGIDCKTKIHERNNELLLRMESSHSIKLVYVGRIEAEKRVDRAIDLIKIIKQNGANVHLYIFGDGSLKQTITNQVNRLGLEKEVSWLGVVPSPMDYFEYFDCLILTSDREGLPFVIWQAMASGLPIISTSVGGVTEVLKKSKSGFTFDKENLYEAFEKIQLFVNNQILKTELGQNGIKAINTIYSSEKFKNFIENLYFGLQTS